MKRRNKGFTLIELLAVIVVLAVIALISVPIVLNIVETSRKGAFERSVGNASKAVEFYLAENKLEKLPKEGIAIGDLEITGKLKSGKFSVENDELIAEYITDGVYCAYGPTDDLIIEKSCNNLDITEPIIDASKLIVNSTSSSVTVVLLEEFAKDQESDIKEYKIELYNGKELVDEIKTNKSGSYEFNKLTKEQTYNIKITVTNGKGLKSYAEKEVSTKSLNKPTIEITPVGLAQEKNVEISLNENGKVEGYTIFYCVDDNGSCYAENASFIEYKDTFKINKNGTIVAKVSDGKNYSDEISQLVTTIDGSAPTKATFSYTRTSKSITVIAAGEDAESDIYGYRFSNDGGKTWTDIQTTNSYTYENIATGTYDIKVRVINGTYLNSGENEKSYLDSEIGKVATVEIVAPTYKVTPEGWATSKTVTITYPSGYTNEYSIDGGKTWKPYAGEIKFTENGNVVARVTDGKNYVKGSDQAIVGIDTEAPTCTWSGESTSWRQSATITATCDDNEKSGCSEAYKEFKYNTGDATTKTATLSYIFTDAVGNSSECKKTVNVYVDRTGPTCTWSGESTSWRTSGTIKATCVDTNGSGCNTTKEWSYSSGTTKTAALSYTFKDAVGNSAECKKTANVYVDKQGPGCTWSGESTSWRQSATITATCNDNGGSGCNASNPWTYTSGTATTKTAALSYTFKDALGNSATCSKTANVYVDRTAPTCTWSGESTSWRTSGTIKATCADTNGSGCTSDTSSKSWGYTSGTTTTKTAALSYTMKDAVGNSATCSKTANVYVDRTPPTVSLSGVSPGGYAVWTSNCSTNWEVRLGATDSGSGIAVSSGLAKLYWSYLNKSGQNLSGFPMADYDSLSSYSVVNGEYRITSYFKGAGSRLRVGVYDNAGNYSTVGDVTLNAYCDSDYRFTYAIVTK